MSDESETEADGEDEPKKGGKKGLLIGVALAAILGGGGFFASFSGMLPFLGGGTPEPEPEKIMVATEVLEFVPIDRMVITLGAGGKSRLLNFGAALEVEPQYKEEVANLLPRVLDILNTYLRAVELKDIESPSSMTRLRAQMLRRVNIVVGDGRVKDLLITEFVLN